jgi:hypothetical protein
MGMKHNVVHIKVFGCVAYAQVLDELRKKLDKKGHKCIFFGYSEDTKAYKLHDPITRKVIISSNVQFEENEAWDGSIERIVRIIDAIGHDDTKDEVVKKKTYKSMRHSFYSWNCDTNLSTNYSSKKNRFIVHT